MLIWILVVAVTWAAIGSISWFGLVLVSGLVGRLSERPHGREVSTEMLLPGPSGSRPPG